MIRTQTREGSSLASKPNLFFRRVRNQQNKSSQGVLYANQVESDCSLTMKMPSWLDRSWRWVQWVSKVAVFSMQSRIRVVRTRQVWMVTKLEWRTKVATNSRSRSGQTTSSCRRWTSRRGRVKKICTAPNTCLQTMQTVCRTSCSNWLANQLSVRTVCILTPPRASIWTHQRR